MIKDAPELVVDKTVRINAPREHVFKLLSDPKEMKRWEPITSFEARVGGRYQFEKGEWIAVGEIIEYDPPRAIAYTWDWKNSPLGSRTVVRYELEADGKARNDKSAAALIQVEGGSLEIIGGTIRSCM